MNETYTKISDTEAEVSRTEVKTERVSIVELRKKREEIINMIDDIRAASNDEIAKLQVRKDIINARIQELKNVGVV